MLDGFFCLQPLHMTELKLLKLCDGSTICATRTGTLLFMNIQFTYFHYNEEY